MKRTAIFFAMVALAFAGAAQATVITGAQIVGGPLPPGVSFSSVGGAIDAKAGFAPYTGAGVSGLTAGEIDPGESITGSFATPGQFSFFQLMVLFDGPEYNDTEEIAKVTATLFGGGTLVGTLSTDYISDANGLTAYWSLPGTVSNISPATASGAGVWRVDNPFGSALITDLKFESVSNLLPGGECPNSGGCTNDSDYAIESLGYEPVPEPGTLLLIGSGLLGLTRVRRRRS